MIDRLCQQYRRNCRVPPTSAIWRIASVRSSRSIGRCPPESDIAERKTTEPLDCGYRPLSRHPARYGGQGTPVEWKRGSAVILPGPLASRHFQICQKRARLNILGDRLIRPIKGSNLGRDPDHGREFRFPRRRPRQRGNRPRLLYQCATGNHPWRWAPYGHAALCCFRQ
jgi:hypothetical protein